MDETKIYVIYKDGKKLDSYGKRPIYEELSSAKGIITKLARESLLYTGTMIYEDLNRDEQKRLLIEKKKEYEIRIFTDSGEKAE